MHDLVHEHCAPREIEHFDIAPYERGTGIEFNTPEAQLYTKLKKFIRAPYHPNNICIAFNVGSEKIYDGYNTNSFEYEQSKFKKRNKEVLTTLKVGDFVDAKFIFGDEISNCEVKELNEHSIVLIISGNYKIKTLSEPIGNIIYIKKLLK